MIGVNPIEIFLMLAKMNRQDCGSRPQMHRGAERADNKRRFVPPTGHQ